MKLSDERAGAVAAETGGVRVSLEDLEAKVAHKYFVPGEVVVTWNHMIEDKEVPPTLEGLTLCVLVMCNGFIVIGKSAPADPRNYDSQLGRDFAYEDALRQAWQLEGYLLREHLWGKQINVGPGHVGSKQ